MCMLTFVPPEIAPNIDALMNGAAINDDGHGFAIVTGPRIIVQRGMKADRLVEDFARLRRKHPSGPALFHSRMATHGTVGKANCHPFRVGGDSRTVLAHNGILPRSVQPVKGDRRSDTRILAEDILPHDPFGSIGSRRSRDRLARWLSPYNKLVILTLDPRFQRNAYLINELSGVWDGGVWYSNTDYADDGYCVDADAELYWARGLAGPSSGRCGACLEIDAVDPVTRFCRVCGTCDDCLEPGDYCVCYVPAKLTGQSSCPESSALASLASTSFNGVHDA